MAVPPGVVIVMGPVVAPSGTVAVMVDVTTTKLKAASIPLNFTFVALVKSVPVIVTTVPTGPLDGEKFVITGGSGGVVAVKSVLLVATPAEVITMIGPLVALRGTAAVMDVGEDTRNALELVPLKCTAITSMKLLPVIATF